MSGDCHRFVLYPRSILHFIRRKSWWKYAKICYERHLPCICLVYFFKPEAVSKHSVSLWIGYSGHANTNLRPDKRPHENKLIYRKKKSGMELQLYYV